MKMRRFLCVALCLPSLFGWQKAHRAPQNKTVIEAPVEGANIVQLISQFKKAGGVPRTEFETTAAFQQRSSLPESLQDAMVFPLVMGADQSIDYSADKEMLLVSVFTRYTASAGQVIALRRVVQFLPPYMGSNAFGVSKPITRKVIEEQGIAVPEFRPLIGLKAHMSVADAQKNKPLLCLAIAGTISQAVVYSDTSRHEPTIQDPIDSVVNGEYIRVRPTHVVALSVIDSLACLGFCRSDHFELGVVIERAGLDRGSALDCGLHLFG
jgi:hypothetical protein